MLSVNCLYHVASAGARGCLLSLGGELSGWAGLWAEGLSANDFLKFWLSLGRPALSLCAHFFVRICNVFARRSSTVRAETQKQSGIGPSIFHVLSFLSARRWRCQLPFWLPIQRQHRRAQARIRHWNQGLLRSADCSADLVVFFDLPAISCRLVRPGNKLRVVMPACPAKAGFNLFAKDIVGRSFSLRPRLSVRGHCWIEQQQ